MSAYRFDIQATVGPAHQGLVPTGRMLLVRVRVFDGPCCQDPEPEAYTDLHPRQARELAFVLLAAAEHAERQSRAADYWRAP